MSLITHGPWGGQVGGGRAGAVRKLRRLIFLLWQPPPLEHMARPKAVLALSVALCNYHAVVGRSASHASSEGLALEPGARPPRWQRCEPGKNDRLELALPCRNGPFLLDTLLHYGEGVGGSLITRQQQRGLWMATR